ncbi:MAG: hypothetical protein ACI4KA_00130 [Oscillospiraceae bacterium]
MGEIIFTTIINALYEALEKAIEDGIKYVIHKVVDGAGRCVTQIVQQIDTDGDGVYDDEVVLYTIETMIPDLSDGYCLVSDGDTVGIGMPMFEIVDGIDIIDYVDTTDVFHYPTVTANGNGYLLDADGDGDVDDVLVPLDDLTGDGMPDWGLLVDSDDNGIPDASPDAPYYELGSPEYKQIIARSNDIPSIIVMSPDGTMSVYDTNGQITAEDCDTAYSFWVSENGIMDKQLDNYSVTEGLLLCLLLLGGFYFVKSLFKRKDVYR